MDKESPITMTMGDQQEVDAGMGSSSPDSAGGNGSKLQCAEDVVALAGLMENASHEGVEGLRQAVPAERLLDIFRQAAAWLSNEATLVHVEVQGSSAVVDVVGDTHGQFHDVLRIFSMFGTPKDSNLFIFNGDFVDRGAWGVETLTLLLAWKLVCPSATWLLRGNHESYLCTRSYGFLGELKAKYPDHHKEIYTACKKVFAALPLAALVADKTLVLHGGLFRKPVIRGAKRRKLAFSRPIRKRQAPLVLGGLEDLRQSSKGGIDPCGLGSTTVAGDVLWSDPHGEDGISLNASRGVGIMFGPDMTEQFLQANGLKLIIRSHEGPDARFQRDDLPSMMTGYSVDHSVPSGTLMTVFSAPDYPQYQCGGGERNNNEGAILVLRGPDFTAPEAKCFTAAPRPDYAGPFYDISVFSDSELELGASDTATSDSGQSLCNATQEDEEEVEQTSPEGFAQPDSVTCGPANAGLSGNCEQKSPDDPPCENIGGEDVKLMQGAERCVLVESAHPNAPNCLDHRKLGTNLSL